MQMLTTNKIFIIEEQLILTSHSLHVCWNRRIDNGDGELLSDIQNYNKTKLPAWV